MTKQQIEAFKKITPGKWLTACYDTQVVRMEGNILSLLANVYGEDEADQNQQIFNTQAIAALPDLLDEREKMIAALMAISSRDPMSAVCGDDPKLCKLQCFGCMARTVLIEAEGGE